MHCKKPGSPKPHIEMVVWGGAFPSPLGWWWWEAEPGESLQREMLPSKPATRAQRGTCSMACLCFPGLLGLGCKPRAAWTHGPERLALEVLVYQHRSLENFISNACSCYSECCLQGSWQFNEILGIQKVSVLYPSACFYENPYLVGTLKSVSVWIKL